MRNTAKRGGVWLFVSLLLMYGAFFAGRYWWLGWTHGVRLGTARLDYFHYEFVEIVLRTHDPEVKNDWRLSPPTVTVTRAGAAVTTIAGLRELTLKPDGSGDWVARWPCPWNAPVGSYGLALSSAGALGGRLQTTAFKIVRRPPHPLPKGFVALTLESDLALKSVKVAAPDGTMKDWRGMLDWVEYMGADAFWVMGGRTPGLKPGEVWLDNNFEIFPIMAQECQRRGIKFGIYAMFSLTMSATNKVPYYEYARDVEDGRSYETRAISLRDPRRVVDVAELLRRFRDIKGVDYLGLDYIRNALGGAELIDEFYREMPVAPPAGWSRLNFEERMVMFARKKGMRKDMAFIDAWQWWRAHRTAQIVRRIKDEVGDSKPLWAFTLTWDKGWHHGQDPVMMNDAGVDADALMLYEANAEQYTAMLRSWHGYVKRGDVQLVVGNIIDWPLHQRHPDGPKEFARRTTRAIDGIFGDGPATGMFVHDLGRALWGRKGTWTTRQWMDQAKAAADHMRARAK